MNVIRQLAVERVPVLRFLEPFGEITSLGRAEALQRHDP